MSYHEPAYAMFATTGAILGSPFDPKDHLWALDFDGVLCDTEPESSLSGWRAAAKFWPLLFDKATPEDKAQVMQSMAKLRPIIETGYENMLLVRLMYEELLMSRNSETGTRPLTVGEVSANWGELLPSLLQRWGLEPPMLIDFFGQVRDEWMEEDLAAWLAPNTMYPGLVDALNASEVDMYIITTKQQRFAHALLKDAGCTKFLDKSKIYGLGMGSKVEVMRDLQSRPEYQGRTLHFIEDRLKTLQGVIKAGDDLSSWQLYLCDWGYCTPSDLRAAMSQDRISEIRLPDFAEALQRPQKWTPSLMPKLSKNGSITIGLGP